MMEFVLLQHDISPLLSSSYGITVQCGSFHRYFFSIVQPKYNLQPKVFRDVTSYRLVYSYRRAKGT